MQPEGLPAESGSIGLTVWRGALPAVRQKAVRCAILAHFRALAGPLNDSFCWAITTVPER